jgi:hypothetical protein
MEVIATVNLPFSDPRSHELSGITWDAARGVALAISDETPQVVEVRPSSDFRSWSLGDVTAVQDVVPWDGEGIALAGDRMFIANERPPRVVELERTGRARGDLVLPEYFRSCRPNRCLESLSAAPDGRHLFTANETSLESDGPAPNVDKGATIHIVRFDLETGARREWRYLTDAVCAAGPAGEVGVSDLAALGSDDLLVMERSYVPNVKNRVRVYRVRLASSEAVRKELVLDVSDLEPSHSFVPNYEGIGIGPRLPDGRRLLLLVSDDNARPDQRRTLLVLAMRRAS